MEEQAVLMETLYEKAKEYAATNLEIAKLKAVDKAAEVTGAVVPRLVVIVALLLFVFVFNIAVSLWLGGLLGKTFYGFFAVSGFYLLVALIVHFMQPSLKRKITDAVILRLLH